MIRRPAAFLPPPHRFRSPHRPPLRPGRRVTLALAVAALGAISGAFPGDALAQPSPVLSPGENVRIGAWIQPAWNYRGVDGEEDLQGFFLRRARLDLNGQLLGGQVRFRLLPDLTRSPELRDAWVEVRGGLGGNDTGTPALRTSLRMGQQTVPFDLQRERNMGLAHFGDRAIAARRFELSGGRDVGVVGLLGTPGGRLLVSGGIFNGQGANRSDPGRSPLLGGRVSASLGGEAARGETDLARAPTPVVTLSTGAMTHRHSFLRPRPGFAADRTVDWHGWTADLHARWRGASLAGAWFEQVVDAGGNDERGDGFFLSAGWVPPPGWVPSSTNAEFVVRHSRAIWDTARDAGPDQESSVGLTVFHRGHELQTRIQFSREVIFVGSAAERRTRVLTLEHQLLLGG